MLQAIIIIASYVDDNLAFTNCATLSKEFKIHCNVKFPMNAERPVNWYLSVKYDRDPNYRSSVRSSAPLY